MGKKYRHLNNDERCEVINKCKNEENFKSIAHQYSVDEKTIRRIYKKFLVTNDFKRETYVTGLRGVREQEIVDIKKTV